MRNTSMLALIVFLLTTSSLALAGVTTATVDAQFTPKPMPSPKKPAAGEQPAVEIDGVRFFQRFNRDEADGKARLGTGGHLLNSGETERSVRVCVAFFDAGDNLIYVEILDTTLGKLEAKTVMPLRKVPAEQVDKITKYRVTIHVSPKPFLD